MPKDTAQTNLSKFQSISPEHNSFCILKRSIGIGRNRVEKPIISPAPSSFEFHLHLLFKKLDSWETRY